MQFIGTGFRATDEVDFNLIRDKAAMHDLLASKTISEGNFSEGLQDFASHFDLSFVQFSAFNEDDKKASSRQISDELMEFHRSSKRNDLSSFFQHGSNGITKKVLPAVCLRLECGRCRKARKD